VRLVQAGQSARITFLLMGLNGAKLTGLTHGTTWQAKYSVNGGSATSITSGNGGEIGDGVYYATLTTSTAGDRIDFWATYTTSGVNVTAPGEMVLVVDYDPKTVDKTGFSLTGAYDAAKTAAAPGALMDLVDNPNAPAIASIQAGLGTSGGLSSLQTHGDSTWATATGFSTFDPSTNYVILDAIQSQYAPAKAGDEMDLVDAPNATAIAAIQNGLATSAGTGDASESSVQKVLRIVQAME